MSKRLLWSVMVIGGAFALACTGSEEGTDVTDPPEPPPVPDTPPEPPPAPDAPSAGAMPFDFPNTSLSASAGQFVLTPPRQPLDEALASGDSGSYIYYGAELISVGPEASTVRSLSGTEFEMPNAMIIPIPAGGTASKGDIVLGHWESGSGLQRAIVVGGSATEPVVRYLDIAYDNPSGWGHKDDTFQAGRFQVISAAGQVGATVACQTGSGYSHGILTAASGGRILVSGFAGSLKAYDRGECVDLTPKPKLEVGQTVHVPVVGSYTEGKVTKLEMDIGRVTVSYTWGGNEEEKVFSITNVTPSFEAPAPSAGNTAPVASNDDDGDDDGDSTPSTPNKGKGKAKIEIGKVGKLKAKLR